MIAETTNQVLNRLHVIHSCSLVNYLMFAPPWWRDANAGATALLREIAREQQDLADRIGALIVEENGTLIAGQFPSRFTTMHDLSSEFILAELHRYQLRTVEAIDKCVAQLPEGSLAQALAQEALGVAKAHLDSLRELTAGDSAETAGTGDRHSLESAAGGE